MINPLKNTDSAEKTSTSHLYTEEELMIRLKVFIGGCLAFTLVGIVFTVLYSIMFVTQPLNAISPVDNKFFELIIPIATFLTGTLSGIMLAGTGKDAFMTGAAQGAKAANGTAPAAPAPIPVTQSTGSVPLGGNGASMMPPAPRPPAPPPPPPASPAAVGAPVIPSPPPPTF
jgi:hypothetical protein